MEVIMNLSTLIRDENTCQICEKNKLNFFFKISRLPYKTVNNYSYKKENHKAKKTLNTKYCSYCKVVVLQEPLNLNFLYKNFKNQLQHSNLIKLEVKKKLHYSKKINLINIGKSTELFDNKFLKNVNYFKFDPTVNKEDKVNKKLNSLSKFLKNKKNKIDLFVLENFISNLSNINEIVNIISRALNENGKILIYNHYGTYNIEKIDLSRFYHEHIFYFSLKSLLILFKKNNLYINKIKLNKKKDFLWVVVEKKQNYISRDLRKIILNENHLNKYSFFHFKKILKKNYNKLHNILSQKYIIYVYGCSVGAITLMTFYNLKNFIFKIIDDNPIIDKMFLQKKLIYISKIKDIEFPNKKKIILNLIPRHHERVLLKIKKYMKKGDLYINFINDLQIKKF
jgi:hypothetical protein